MKKTNKFKKSKGNWLEDILFPQIKGVEIKSILKWVENIFKLFKTSIYDKVVLWIEKSNKYSKITANYKKSNGRREK